MPRTADSGFDAAVVDRENHTVALIEAKAHPEERWATILPRQLEKFAERVDFVIAIDPNCIQLYRSGERASGSRLPSSIPGKSSGIMTPSFPESECLSHIW